MVNVDRMVAEALEAAQPPTIEQLMDWLTDSGCEATDGCWVEHDGVCPHGKPSWLIVAGLI